MGDIRREEVDVDDLVFNPENPNEMTKKEAALLQKSIQEVGFIDPPQVVQMDSGKFFVVGGEHRARAAMELGMRTIPVDVLQGDKWQDQDLIKFVTVRMNVLHGKMNPEKFLKIYNQVVNKYGKEEVAQYMGYTSQDGIKNLIGVMSKGMKESMSPEIAAEFEEEAKEAKTVTDLNNIVQKLLNEYGDTMKYNFMVFAWGGKEHIYIAMTKETHQDMKKIMKMARKQEIDINEIFAEALKDIANSIQDPE
jgi:hypothetical protein